MRCGAVQRELSCVWMRCGAACGQSLQTQRSMRMHFLLSAPSLAYSVLFLVSQELRHAYDAILCYKLHEEFQLIPFMHYKPVKLLFLYKRHPTPAVLLGTWITVISIWPSSQCLIDRSPMILILPLETFDPSLLET